ncbi:MAG: zinc-binding dehydrogenase [Chloroflexi bacterium]|nr:zinc-binding dehydrogenase [Chloroflexota bacterium]
MKAVYVNQQADPNKLIYGDLPEPEIAPDQILVRVRAAALNRRDVFTREASHGIRLQGNAVPGLDYSGEVAAVGSLVKRFKVGDRVLGTSASGAYAEYTKANAANSEILPDNLTFEEGAAIPTVFTTAWRMLIPVARLRPAEDVLIMAAGSGVGSAGIQIAKEAGARVFATASTDEKLEKAKDLGIDFGINYKRDNFAKRVMELTDGRGVDIVFEHIGTPVWDNCFASLAPFGRFVTCGVSAGHMVNLHLGRLWTRDIQVLGTHMRPQEDLAPVTRMVAQGRYKAIISAVYDLQDADKAQELMETDDFFGKIILRVP